MSLRGIRGWLFTIIAALVLIAMAVLVLLQWNNPAQLNVYGVQYNVQVEDGKAGGGVNTALLMLASAFGGLAAYGLARLLVHGVRLIRVERRVHEVRHPPEKTSEP